MEREVGEERERLIDMSTQESQVSPSSGCLGVEVVVMAIEVKLVALWSDGTAKAAKTLQLGSGSDASQYQRLLLFR